MGEVSGLVVNRWRRYGKDRLYVAYADGTKVGYWDLTTDTGHPEGSEHLAVLTQAANDWRAGGNDARAATSSSSTPPPSSPEASVASPVAAPETPSAAHATQVPAAAVTTLGTAEVHDHGPVETTRPWFDLASNRPGEAARAQALSARDAAPVKTVLARVIGVHTDERAWRIGADGEEKVAARIDKAIRKEPRWRVLHAIPVGDRGSDIDHLLIGPGGVFTVNAKHHPGAKIWVGGNTFLVDGHRQPYVRNSRHEAVRAAKLLSAACAFPVHVEGLIVTVNAQDVVIKAQPEGVHVTWRKNLTKWMLRLGPVLTDERIESVYEAARRSTTWRT